MTCKFTNNAYSTLASGITDSDTAIALAASTGARFPTLGVGDYFFATLIDNSLNLEIVKVTARTGDNLTVERGVDDTTPQAFVSGDRIELRVCVAMLEAFRDENFANPAFTTQTLVDGANVDWNMDLGTFATLTIAGNRTMNAPTNLKAGGSYTLKVIHDGANRTLTWNALFHFDEETPPALSTVTGRRDLLNFTSDGTRLYGGLFLRGATA